MTRTLSLPSRVAMLYLLYGTLMVLLLASLMPPFQNADETGHYARADQVAHGGFLARRGADAPALIDTGIIAGGQRFSSTATPPDLHVARSLYEPIPWGDRQVAGTSNIAVYPPTFYLPAAIGILAAQKLGLTVLPTLQVARVASGLVAVALGAVAIATADAAAIWIFAILTLPMALVLTAAMTQDGPMLAAAALAAVCCVRLQNPAERRHRTWLALLCVTVALIAMARPPYLPLALLPMLCLGLARSWRAACAVVTLAAVTAWCVVAIQQAGLPPPHGAIDPGGQAMALLHAPWRIFTVPVQTLIARFADLRQGFIGVTVTENIALPPLYRRAVYAILALAAVATLLAGAGRRTRYAILWIAATVVASAYAILLVKYVTWTDVGAPLADGVQGRYFLPLALIAGAIFARPMPSGSRTAALLAVPVLLFPIASIVVVLHGLMLTYYL